MVTSCPREAARDKAETGPRRSGAVRGLRRNRTNWTMIRGLAKRVLVAGAEGYKFQFCRAHSSLKHARIGSSAGRAPPCQGGGRESESRPMLSPFGAPRPRSVKENTPVFGTGNAGSSPTGGAE